MESLVGLAQAKQHLRITATDTATDEEIQDTLDHATEIVINYLKSQADAGWTDTVPPSVPVPGPVKAATLLIVTHLYENRGDDMKADEALWAAVGRLLVRYRDPALA